MNADIFVDTNVLLYTIDEDPVSGAGPDAEDIFAEMLPFMVGAPDVDDEREAIYTRMEGD
jgi:hypothetical protein